MKLTTFNARVGTIAEKSMLACLPAHATRVDHSPKSVTSARSRKFCKLSKSDHKLRPEIVVQPTTTFQLLLILLDKLLNRMKSYASSGTANAQNLLAPERDRNGR
jgi:hypothetical protein